MSSTLVHIEITPGVSGGKPRIAGHRITVYDLLSPIDMVNHVEFL